MKKYILLIFSLFFFWGQLVTAQEDPNANPLRCKTDEEKCHCLWRIAVAEGLGGCYCEGPDDNRKWFNYDPNAEGSKIKPVRYCIELQEALPRARSIGGDNGLDLLGNYISTIYKYGASIIGIISVLIIVISGIQIMMGGADPEMVSEAKTRIFQAILSLVILFLSAAILITVNPGFFGG